MGRSDFKSSRSRPSSPSRPTSIHSRVGSARDRLRAAGIPDDEADLDARLLAEHVLGWDTARFFSTAAADPEPAGFAERYEALVARRTAREPISYIVGHHEFWGLRFEVSSAVLIPRPETELIVEIGLEVVRDRSAEARIADVCTGSGCIAIALASERRSATVVAADTSDAALELARRNAATHAVDQGVRFVNADVLEGVDGPFDMIVANPPYVRDGDRATLQPEVRDHEPPQALFAGADGLDVIRRLVAQAPTRLESGGMLVFEIGFGQAEAVDHLISGTDGLKMIGLRRDLQGIPRAAIAGRA
jgi:release factor glutamine methyltransferase